jgi:hypothetical protein
MRSSSGLMATAMVVLLLIRVCVSSLSFDISTMSGLTCH